MKTPSVKDYAGDCYVRNRRRRTKIGVDTVGSFRCVDCNTLRYVAPNEWTRASKPRCTACGGWLQDSHSFDRREYGTKTAQKQRIKEVEAVKAKVRESRKCYSCGHACDGAMALAHHITLNSDCAYEYRADKQVFQHNGVDYCRGTTTVTYWRGSYVIVSLPLQGDRQTQLDYLKFASFEQACAKALALDPKADVPSTCE